MERVKTGIPELDDMLRGGFMEGDAVLLAGSAGTGKTTLALQYIVNGITRFGDKGIYVTFEELPDQIYRDAKNFGWDLSKMEKEDKLRLVCTSPNLLLEGDEGERILDEPIRDIQPRRLVVDSLSHLAMFVEKKELRKEAYRLMMYLKTKGLSSLFTWESSQTSGQAFSATDVGLSFLVDCIILLRYVEIESSMKKALLVLKMRGSDHDKGLREFKITGAGVEISSPFKNLEGILSGAPRRIPEESFAEAFAKAAGKGGGKQHART